jgi:chromosome segregation ATPase
VLPFILGCIGRATRLAGTQGLVTALLRMLAVAATECDAVTMQVTQLFRVNVSTHITAEQIFEDPANFFVIDLCSSVSEVAGIAPLVQTMACMFLGSCYMSLGAPADKKKHKKMLPEEVDHGRLTQSKLLGMIDSKVGLSRFTEILRKPLASPRSGSGTVTPNPTEVFVTRGFKVHYEKLIESIRSGILKHYSTGESGVEKDSPQLQIISMLNARVQELECELIVEKSKTEQGLHAMSAASLAQIVSPKQHANADTELISLRSQLAAKDKLLSDFAERKRELENESEELCQQITAAETIREEYAATIAHLRRQLQDAEVTIKQGEPSIPADLSLIRSLEDTVSSLRTENHSLNHDVTLLKQKVSSLECAPSDAGALGGSDHIELRDAHEDLNREIQVLNLTLSANNENWDRAADLILRFAGSVGLQSACESVDKIGIEIPADYTIQCMQNVLDACAVAVNEIANKCSDMAQGLQINDLEGDEGTIERINDCFTKLQRTLEDQNDHLHQFSEIESELRMTVDALQSELASVKAENESLAAEAAGTGNTPSEPTSTADGEAPHLQVSTLESDLVSARTAYELAKAQWESESNRMLQKLFDLESERDANMNIIETLKTEVKTVKESFDNYTGDDVASSLRIRVKKQLDEINALKEKHEAYVTLTKSKLKEAVDALAGMDADKKRLRDECSGLEAVNNNLLALNEALNSEHNRLQIEHGTVKQELDENMKALEYAAVNAKSMQDKLASAGVPSAAAKTGSELENADLNSLRLEVDKKSKQYEIAQELVSTLKSQLQQAVAEAKVAEDEKDGVIEDLKAEISELTSRVAASLRSAELADELVRINDGRTAALIAEFEAERRAFNDSIKEGSTAMEKCISLGAQVDSLQAENQELEAARAKLLSRLETEQANVAALREEVESIRGFQDSLQEDHVMQQNDRDVLLAQLNQSRQELDAMRSDCSLEQQRCSNAVSQLAVAEANVSSLTTELTELKDRVTILAADKESLLVEKEQTAAKLSELSLQFQLSEEENENLAKSLSVKSFEISVANSHIGTMADELTACKETISRLEERVAHAKAAKDMALDINEAVKAQSLEVDRLNDKVVMDVV